MNFKQLTAFREVMLTGSISEAARNLLRTQPAISSLISGMEEEIGVKLFVRQGARVHPTPEAHYLFDEANAILNRLDTVKSTLKSISDLEKGALRVVSIPGPSVIFLPNLISDFVVGKPGIHVTLSTRTSAQTQRSIATQEYDVGLADVGFGKAGDSKLIKHDIIEFQGLCALPINDPLAQKDVITAQDLSDRPMAVPEKNHPSHIQILAAFGEAGAHLNSRYESTFFIPNFTYIERGLAYGIVDPFSAESYQYWQPEKPKIAFRPFRPDIMMPLTIMSPLHRPLSIVAQAFLDKLSAESYRIKTNWAF